MMKLPNRVTSERAEVGGLYEGILWGNGVVERWTIKIVDCRFLMKIEKTRHLDSKRNILKSK